MAKFCVTMMEEMMMMVNGWTTVETVSIVAKFHEYVKSWFLSNFVGEANLPQCVQSDCQTACSQL